MPDLERHALAAAIAEIEEDGQHRPIDRASPVPLAENCDGILTAKPKEEEDVSIFHRH
jgi:hypothetical protein